MTSAGRESTGGEGGQAPLPLLPTSITPTGRARFLSIGAKLGLAVVLVISLASVAAFLFSAARERDALVQAKQKSADMVADLFAESLRAPLDFADADAVQNELRHLKQNQDLAFAAVWHEGDAQPMGTLGQLRPASRAVGGLANAIDVQRKVRGSEGQVVGRLQLQFLLERENAAYLAGRQRLLWMCLAMALGTVGVLLTVTRRQVVAPVDALLRAVRRIERGERGVRVGAHHHDEIGRLAGAVEAMGEAIVDREDRLAEALGSLRELFDHLRQAIVVFDREGRVVGAQSREACKLFGLSELAGASVRELLYAGRGEWDAELQAFDAWLVLAFDARAEDFAEVLALAPPEVQTGSGERERYLTLEFRPIESKGAVQRIMLLATDDTEKRRLAETVVAQGQSHARQMAAMQRLVSDGGQQFVSFLRAARGRLGRALALCSDKPQLQLPALNECFGHVHTLTSEARAFGLDDLAAHLRGLESGLSEIRRSALAAGAAEVKLTDSDLRAPLAAAEVLLDEAERLFVEASPIGRAVLSQVTVRQPDLEELCQLAASQGGKLGALAERLSARGLGELLSPFAERTGRWAESAGKRARLEVEGRETLISERLAQVLGGALTHLLRNAIAHGIEAPEDRERTKKPSIGVITVGAVAPDGELASLIFVEDDGVGFSDNSLLSRAASRGDALRPEDSDSGSFRQAAPVVDDELQGRGMGLSAVLRDLQAAGYALRACQGTSGGARFEITRDAAKSRISA